MSPFEYLLALVSILIGLAVTDLSSSVHRLIRARRRVRWDWLPLCSATLVTLLILEFWWIFYGLGQSPVWTHYAAFLLLAASMVGIFLLASAALPDEVPAEGLDLAEYYRVNAGYFWTLFGAFVVVMVAVEVTATWQHGHRSELLWRTVLNLVFASMLFSLAWIEKRRYHALLVPVLLAVLLIQWSGLRLA